MNGPLCRLAAATCLVVLAMVPGRARAEPIRITEPTIDYPGLAEKPAEPDAVPDVTPTDDTTMVEWPVVDSTQVLPVKADDTLMNTMSGGERDCPCICPQPTPTPTPTPTPAEQAPEPSALLLFGLGSLGLALARRRK